MESQPERICQNCNCFKAFDPDLAASWQLPDMPQMDGECTLRHWEVTAAYTCEDFAASSEPAPQPG